MRRQSSRVSLFAEHNIPFTAALVLMALLALVQVMGLAGFQMDTGPDVDGDGASAVDGLASLAGLGRVPFMIWLAALLLLFALLGLGVQALASDLLGAPLNRWLAAVIAGVAALPATALLVRPLARILPQDETTAVGLDTLVGRRATITIGRARAGSPARALVNDRFGHSHHVMVEPHDGTGEIREGEIVLLVRREQEIFYGMPLQEQQLAPIG